MITDTQRTMLFLGGCIPLRAAIAYYAMQATKEQLRIMGLIALITASVFFFVWFTGARSQTGAFGGKVWWAPYRLLHSILIFLFAINALAGSNHVWKWLAADTTAGLALFTLHKLGWTFS
jgi:hypothetical protein